MAIPDVSTAAIQQAMDRFDKEFRNTPDWLNWQEDETHKYAIQKNDQLYPVKQIVSLATGAPVSAFHGGDQANSYVEARGFKVVPPPRQGNRTWIFQANPQLYDVRAAIRKLARIAWGVRRYKEQIALGDRVYLWESGPQGGIVGVARVVAPVSTGPMPSDDVAFWKKEPEKTDLDKAWVQLRILGIVEPVLERAQIASAPELLRIFRIFHPGIFTIIHPPPSFDFRFLPTFLLPSNRSVARVV